MITALCMQFKILHHNYSLYRPKMNGDIEASNKNIKKITQKMTVTYKDWHEMLPIALHGYCTTARTSTRATPYSLVYNMEEYEACIMGLRAAIDLRIKLLNVFRDSALVISQIKGEWCNTPSKIPRIILIISMIKDIFHQS